MKHPELIHLKSCPVCKHESFKPFLVCKDFTVSNLDFNIVSCESCGFKFTNPIPSEETISEYYKSSEYVSHSGTKKGLINFLYHKVRSHTLKKKHQLVSSLATEKNILDIGCGTGDFLGFCKKNGWNTLGLEPDPDAQKMAKENHALNVQPLDHLEKIEAHSYDIITMWHVLEHVMHLRKDVASFKRVLKPNGRLIIAVPNCSSKDAEKYKENWAAYDVPRHLYHFTPADIKLLFEQFDMELENVLPMKFDSYYVSMLSEKNIGGNIIKGFWNGWRSNLAANSKNNKYSSQIYVLKNKA